MLRTACSNRRWFASALGPPSFVANLLEAQLMGSWTHSSRITRMAPANTPYDDGSSVGAERSPAAKPFKSQRLLLSIVAGPFVGVIIAFTIICWTAVLQTRPVVPDSMPAILTSILLANVFFGFLLGGFAALVMHLARYVNSKWHHHSRCLSGYRSINSVTACDCWLFKCAAN